MKDILENESQDSRSLLAGRKRGFEEASQDEDGLRPSTNFEGNGAHKRIREDLSEAAAAAADASSMEVEAQSISISNSAVAKTEGEVVATSDPSSASGTVALELLSLRKKQVSSSHPDTEIEPAHERQTAQTVIENPGTQTAVPPPAGSWNSGIRTGLRTSFGTKKARRESTTDAETSPHTASLPMHRDFAIHVERHSLNPANSAPEKSEKDNPTYILPPSLELPLPAENMQSERTKRPRPSRRKVTPLTALDTSIDDDSEVHVPFKKIKHKQLSLLPPDERLAYKRAKKDYEAKDPEKVRRKKERAERELAKVTNKEQSLSKAGKKRTQSLNNALDSTACATELMVKLGWPLPKDQHHMADLIRKGDTFYPRKFESSAVYHKNNAEFLMSPMLDSDGLPIQFPKISFNEFAVQLLLENSDKWASLASDSLAKAFTLYANFFYSNHYYSDGASWRAKLKDLVSTENNAFTLQEAVAEATRELSLMKSSVAELGQISSDLPTAVENLQSILPLELAAVPTSPQESLAKRTNESKEEDYILIEDEESGDDDASNTSSSSEPEPEPLSPNSQALEYSLQVKYFPKLTGDAIVHCIACSRAGHGHTQCPMLLCTACGEKHSTFRCPDRQRCLKCRGRGHAREDCPEKLGMPPSESSCDFCESREHLEPACHKIWRSYWPQPEGIRTVREITVDCYFCGRENHFGPECGLRSRHGLFTGGFTWSQANLQRYVDPSSDRRAISAGIDYSLPAAGPKGLSIKGKANNPIRLDESSDEGEFLRPRVQAAPEHGNIRINQSSGNRQAISLPRRPASPIAPHRSGYDRGVRTGEDPRHQMSSNQYYSHDSIRNDPVAYITTLQKGPEQNGSNAQGPQFSSMTGPGLFGRINRDGEGSGSRGRAGKRGAPKGARARGSRGRGR